MGRFCTVLGLGCDTFRRVNSENDYKMQLPVRFLLEPPFYRHVCLFLMFTESLRSLMRSSQEGLGGGCC